MKKIRHFIFALFNIMFISLTAISQTFYTNNCHCMGNAMNNGVKSYYTFNKDVLDYSGGTNHGVINNCNFDIDRFGVAEGCLSFNGQNSYLSIPNVVNNFESVTISFWLKYEFTHSQNQYVISNQGPGGYEIYLSQAEHGRNLMASYKGLMNLKSNKKLYPNTWYHIALRQKLSNVTLYINGKEEAGIISSLNQDQSSPTCIVGKDGGQGTSFFKGQIDELRLANRALSEEEIGELRGYNVDCEDLDLFSPIATNGSYKTTGPAGFTSIFRNASIKNVNSSNSGIYTTLITFDNCVDTIYRFIDIEKERSLVLGGTIWGEEAINCVRDSGDVGKNNILVKLYNNKGIEIDSTYTDSKGNYMFTSLLSDTFIVKLDASNFKINMPLYGENSCCESTNFDNDVDDDNQGKGDGPIISNPIKLNCGLEPESGGLENFTIDFCVKPDCSLENPYTVPSCDLIQDTITDLRILEFLCFRLPSPPLVGPAPNPLCSTGGVPHNMSWFAFVAGEGDYSIELNIFDCHGGSNGAQFGIIQMDQKCDFENAVEIYCNGNPCVLGTQVVPATNMIPGQTYFMWVDGCSNSICRYDIEITGDYKQFQIPEIKGIECSSSFGRCDTICSNNKITFEVLENYHLLDAKFHWRITGPGGENTFAQTNDRFYTHEFGQQTGTYTITLLAIDVKGAPPIQPYSTTIEVANPAPENFGNWEVCENDLSDGWKGPPTIWNTDISDPNNDGFSGWAGTEILEEGIIKEIIKTNSGCKVEQTVNVIKLLNTSNILDTFMCPGEILHIGPDFATETNVFPAEEIIFPNEAGCDSVVHLTARYLRIVGGSLQVACVDSGYRLKFFHAINTNIPISYQYQWFNVLGQVLYDGDPDQDAASLLVSKPEEIYLTVGLSKGGKTCNFNIAPINVSEFPQDISANLEFKGTLLGKCTAEVHASGGRPPYTYLWNNGIIDSINTILNPGPYSVTVSDQIHCWEKVLNGECLVVSTNDGYFPYNIEINPNPNSGILNIDFKDLKFITAEIAIISIDGKVLIRKSIEGHAAKTSIDISHFSNGVYFVEITTDNNKLSRKIVLAK